MYIFIIILDDISCKPSPASVTCPERLSRGLKRATCEIVSVSEYSFLNIKKQRDPGIKPIGALILCISFSDTKIRCSLNQILETS